MASQSRLGSLVEACVNTFAGLLFSFVIQKTLNHAYDVEMSNETAAHFVFWFTVASVARSYIVRRIFNSKLVQECAKRLRSVRNAIRRRLSA